MPTLKPILIAPTLLDFTMTSVERQDVVVPDVADNARAIDADLAPGLVSMSVSSGMTFSSMAADAVTTLKVEPGS